jgi:predicted GNAT superfamily acetyltransferase
LIVVKLRDAVAADHEAIVAINRDGQPGVNAFESGEIEACIARATHFRVAESEGAVAGYLLAFGAGFTSIGDEYAWFSARHPAFLYVDQVAVARALWRGGVGAALYADLERAARARGVGVLTCEVNLDPPNPRSLAFHQARGFGEVSRLRVSDGRYVALLERALAR